MGSYSDTCWRAPDLEVDGPNRVRDRVSHHRGSQESPRIHKEFSDYRVSRAMDSLSAFSAILGVLRGEKAVFQPVCTFKRVRRVPPTDSATACGTRCARPRVIAQCVFFAVATVTPLGKSGVFNGA